MHIGEILLSRIDLCHTAPRATPNVQEEHDAGCEQGRLRRINLETSRAILGQKAVPG
jgi:hypothetical protein